ncbi:tyrosine-tRNA ligase [Phialophora macrospora]|uniref:Tyrosine--tRNA ligase n=1 Tax=Phialophora macrospora TaxID=1851006 RepID=A0A0D2FUR4_9EURO|nr:tyrosine-tRNA ligase [Phialophora macrospora]
MKTTAPLRSVRRSLYICRSCRHHLRDRNSALSNPVSQQRWITRVHVRRIQEAEEEWQAKAKDIEAGNMKSMMAVLEERGYVNQIVGSRDDLDKLMTYRRIGAYAGVDPTAPSLHVGHMVPFMALGWLYIHGYKANFLLGGFTASIGDPIGRLKGREAMSPSQRKANMAAMHIQLKRLGASMEKYAERKGYMREWSWRRSLENNVMWWSKVTAREFLSMLGRHIRIGPMLGRDTVKNRLEKGDGMSFAEFSYPLVQAWDWWHLFQAGCQVQIGGADQFGNILAGAEAVKQIAKDSHEYQVALRQTELLDAKRRINVSSDPMGFTVPLLTTSSGEKFGKSAGNAVWLDPEMTSVYDLYQFFLRSADADVEKYLKLLTFLPLPEIQQIMQEHQKDESKRIAQHKLASEFVELIHGRPAAQLAEEQHRKLHNKNMSISDLKASVAEAKATDVHPKTGLPMFAHPSLNKHAQPLHREDDSSTSIKLPRSLVFEKPMSRILWSAGLVTSRTEGQRLINAGGAYVGGGTDAKTEMGDNLTFTPVRTAEWKEVQKWILDDSLLILRSGKWRIKIVSIIPDEEYAALGLSCPGWEEHLRGKSDPGSSGTDTKTGASAGEVEWSPLGPS